MSDEPYAYRPLSDRADGEEGEDQPLSGPLDEEEEEDAYRPLSGLPDEGGSRDAGLPEEGEDGDEEQPDV